ncbi:phage replisome organizer N-terminal domain-containing protein [Niameybacter massiliensis]|uniref:Phage replisome organizer N-terminal domain-containing protein n=1 Tax=Holtiella tumoricola TaxID=3018743 RepID=A0AA42DJE0_9FIRM|nr:phage replisome organizer N-terminal domain-containing protein [Holtiella tumoricola]MDA3730035.1 phage replisome organizer N-terminal domain-containing protein [Holtiella tumoricola]
MAKRFFWLKLKDDFFRQKEIKKLRRVAGGDTLTIIYLKMQLLSIRNGGIIEYEETEDSLEEQLGLELDEEVENVRLTIMYLKSNNLIEQLDENEYLLNKVPEIIGSESDAAERMRKMRSGKCNKVTISCNEVTPLLQDVRTCYTEKEIEKDKEKENKKHIVQQADTVWARYPLKKGKAAAIKKIPKLIEKYGYEQLIRCIERYESGLQKETWRKPQNGSTFFNSGYVDYLDENYHEGVSDNGGNSKHHTAESNDPYSGLGLTMQDLQ